MLESKRPDAPDGELDYAVNGSMIADFAVMAVSAQYGVAGIKNLQVSHRGTVCQHNLGPQTAPRAREIIRFDPEPRWAAVPEQGRGDTSTSTLI